MKYLSVCSGIEAASVAWHPLGWKPVGFAEIEPFPSAVLAHHYPTVPNFGDMTQLHDLIEMGICDAPEILVGGTPCQAFSVAGLRKSLDDARGNLSLVYCDLANAIDSRRRGAGLPPAVLVWENVPGVLSTKDNAFGCFLAGLAGEDEPLVPTGKRWPNAGYVLGPQRAVAWRILDAQYFGLAQRRRRVFVVASARDGFDPPTVLFEWDGVRRDSAPRREAREGSAGRAEGGVAVGFQSSQSGVRLGDTHATLDANNGSRRHNGVIHAAPIARCDTAGEAKRQDWETCNFVVNAYDDPRRFNGPHGGFAHGETHPTLESTNPKQFIAFNARQDPDHWLDRTGPLDTDGGTQAAAFAENSRAEVRLEGGDGSRCGAISTGGGKPGQGVPMIAQTMQVRRLTTTECARLQGFPDNHLDILYRGKPAADGPKYKALGNSMAVPCMRWIGARIDAHIKGELPSPCEAFL